MNIQHFIVYTYGNSLDIWGSRNKEKKIKGEPDKKTKSKKKQENKEKRKKTLLNKEYLKKRDFFLSFSHFPTFFVGQI